MTGPGAVARRTKKADSVEVRAGTKEAESLLDNVSKHRRTCSLDLRIDFGNISIEWFIMPGRQPTRQCLKIK